MKKKKAIFVTLLLASMAVIIAIGLYLLHIWFWKIIAGAFILGGIYYFSERFYYWIRDEGPLDCVELDPDADKFSILPFRF